MAVWLNGAIVPKNQAVVSVFDHGLLYGDGVFEGIRFYDGNAFMLQEHLDRLFLSAAAVLLSIPYTVAQLTDAVCQTIAAYIDNGGDASGYLRLVITRGEGALGVDPASCDKPTVFIIADRLQVISGAAKNQGIRAVIVSTRRVPNICWDARIKSLNYLNNVLARLEARNANADAAILLNHAGNIAEGALNNVFVVKNGELFTPPTTDGALAGITRQVVLQLSGTLGIPAQEKSMSPYDLYTAEECFLTGTGIELVPVREVDGRVVGACPGAVFTQLQKAFTERVQNESKSSIDIGKEG